MRFTINLTKLKNYFIDPLRRNAVFIMLANGLAALIGFFFWLVAARFYSTEEVGLATALISATALLANIAKVGFDFGLVRFLPQSKNRPAVINTCYTIAGLLAIVTAVIFLLGLGVWSPKLLFIRSNWLYIITFVIFTCLTTINQLQGQVLIAFRTPHYILTQNLFAGFRLLTIVLLTFAGTFGIFSSVGIAYFLSVFVGFIFILKKSPGYRPTPFINNNVVREMLGFSFTNYVASIFGSLPVYLLPIIIVGVLTPEAGAYFNVAWSIAGILSMATLGTTSSLLTEGSYDPSNLAKQVIKAIKFNLLFIIPGIVVIALLGKLILSLYGTNYASHSLWLLWLFVIMYLPQSIIMLFLTVARLQMRIKAIILTDATLSILTVGLSCILMKFIGLIGVGIAFVCVQGVVSVIVSLIMLRMVGISFRALLGLIFGREA